MGCLRGIGVLCRMSTQRDCEVTTRLVYKRLAGVVVSWFVRSITILVLRIAMIDFRKTREGKVGQRTRRNVVLNGKSSRGVAPKGAVNPH